MVGILICHGMESDGAARQSGQTDDRHVDYVHAAQYLDGCMCSDSRRRGRHRRSQV